MNPAAIGHTGGAVGRAAALAAAAADTVDPDLSAKIEAELNAALADVEAGSIDLDELVAALAALAGRAIDEAAALRVAASHAAEAPRTRDDERATVLAECVRGLHATEKPTRPDDEPAAPMEGTRPDLRSDQDRRIEERRAHSDDNPAARVNRWLHGQRRSGVERRSGVPRRWSEAEPSRGDD